jgi:hypothetical protein
MSLNDRIRKQVTGWMAQTRPAIGDKELVALLRKHFDALDKAPKDGVIHISEIRAAKSAPPAEFTDKDIAMLELLDSYYNLLREFDDATAGADPGISTADLDVLDKILQDSLTDQMLATLDAGSQKDD